MSIEQNKKVVLGIFEALNKGNAIGALDLLAEDATWWVIGNIPNVSGTHNKQEMSEMFKYMLGSLGGKMNFTVDHIIAEGDYVAVETKTDAKTPKGTVYQNRYHFKFEVKDGKIRTVRAYNDTALIKEIIAGG
jgi:uncharacterized protein